MKPLDSSVNQSTQVAFRIIEEMVAIGEPVELSALARRLDMPKPRVFRFLRTLLSIGYVHQDQTTERYRLSLKLYHLGQAMADQTDLLTEARPLMVQLSEATGQTVTLSVPEPTGMRVLDIVRAHSPVQIVTRPGALLAFHASAMGKLALAFGSPAAWHHLEQTPLTPWTDGTNTDLDVLKAQVERVRTNGWADAPGETLAGVNALSAPVFTTGGRMIAAMTIAGPIGVLPSPPTGVQIEAVCAAARTLSRNLGHMEPAQ